MAITCFPKVVNYQQIIFFRKNADKNEESVNTLYELENDAGPGFKPTWVQYLCVRETYDPSSNSYESKCQSESPEDALFDSVFLVYIHCILSVFTLPKMNLLLIFTFNYKYLKYKDIFNLGIKTVFYLIYNRINGLVGV